MGCRYGDHQKDYGVINLAQTASSRCVGEIVGCRAGEHHEKANGIDQAGVEDPPVSGQRSDAHQYGRGDYTSEGAHYVYDSVCREFAGSMLPRPDRNSHHTPTPILHSGACQASVIKTT